MAVLVVEYLIHELTSHFVHITSSTGDDSRFDEVFVRFRPSRILSNSEGPQKGMVQRVREHLTPDLVVTFEALPLTGTIWLVAMCLNINKA